MNNSFFQPFFDGPGVTPGMRFPFLRAAVFFAFSILIFLNNTASAKTVNVFFAGGQSNATALWAGAIDSALVSSGKFDHTLLVSQYHTGSPLTFWYDGTPGVNYSSDFFAQSVGPAGLLEQANAGIVSAGDEYVFSGLFWFQGETDRFQPYRESYEDNFNGLLGQLSGDLAGNFDPAFLFIMGLVDMDEINYAPGTAQRSDIDALRAVQVSLVNNSPYAGFYLDSKNYSRKDLWHLDAASQVQFGGEMGQVFADNYSPVPIPGAFWLLCTGFSLLVKLRRP